MNDASYDILFVTSDKTEGGIQRALCDWASVCLSASNLEQASLNHTSFNHTGLNHAGLKFAGLTPQNRFSHWLAAHQADTHIHPLTSPLRVMMRYTHLYFRIFLTLNLQSWHLCITDLLCSGTKNRQPCYRGLS